MTVYKRQKERVDAMGRNKMQRVHRATGTESCRRPFFGFLVVFALVLTCFCPVSFGMSCAGVFYPSLAEHFGVSNGMLSFYSSILQLAALVFLPVLGRLFDRIDARLLVCGAVLVVGIDFIALANASSLPMFYVCSFIMGIGMAVLLFLAPSTLINRWFKKKAGLFIGVVMAFTGIGGVVWSSVAGMLINSASWQLAYLAFAVVTLSIVPICWLCIASRPSSKGLRPYGAEACGGSSACETPTEEGAVKVPAGGNVFKTPAFLAIFALCFLLNASMYAYFIIPSYISSLEIGVSMPLLGATAASAAMGGQTIAKVLLGLIGDRHPGTGTLAAIALGLVGLSMLLLFPTSPVAIYAGACLFGVQYGVSFVMMPIFTRKAFGMGDYARIYSRVSMAAAIASVVAGVVGGTVINATGSYALVFGIIIAASALAFAAAALSARQVSSVKKASQTLQLGEAPAYSYGKGSIGSIISAGVNAHVRAGSVIGGPWIPRLAKFSPKGPAYSYGKGSMGSIISAEVNAHVRAGSAIGGPWMSRLAKSSSAKPHRRSLEIASHLLSVGYL